MWLLLFQLAVTNWRLWHWFPFFCSTLCVFCLASPLLAWHLANCGVGVGVGVGVRVCGGKQLNAYSIDF